LPDFKETRIKLLTTLEVDEIKIILDGIRKRWGDFRTEDKTAVYAV
jgi:ribosomal protein S24E